MAGLGGYVQRYAAELVAAPDEDAAAVASLDGGRAAAALDQLVKVSQEAAEEEAG